MEEKKNHGPLLYIYQPFSKTPSIKMQDVYTNRQEKILKKEESEKEELVKETVPIEAAMSGNQEVKHQQEKEKQKFSFKKVKSFKEMNVKERLEYLMEFPKVLPPVPCVFYTKEKSYQGYLQDYQDQEITVQFHDQTSKTIPVSSIKDVIMIGIKK